MIAAYNFNKCWRAKLARWKKRMTIREDRKDGRVPKIGDVFRGYVGMRTKNCELVVEGVVSRVRRIAVARVEKLDEISVWIDGVLLDAAAVAALAVQDGFASVEDFFEWFVPSGKDDFRGWIIEWNELPALGGGRES